MTCRSISSTLRRTQRPRRVSAADIDPLPTPSKLLRTCAHLAPSCALCLLPHMFGKGPSPVHEGDTQALNHAGGHVSSKRFRWQPALQSPCRVARQTTAQSQVRDGTFSSPPTQVCGNNNESRGTRKDGATETQHVCTIAMKTPR